ncbi:MAG: ATP-binding protein [Deltaproteobacteria bacterium]|nr:MAG: ATP-binding protein [Deltaproteobacteria bacterium]
MIKRSLDLTNCNKSLFLFGPRQTGKTSLVRSLFKPDLQINLLRTSEFIKYTKDPSLLRKEVEALPQSKHIIVFIDEIQKCSEMLNEIHALIEDCKVQFILTGSSARKLRQKGVNLLGGRALTYHLFPLTHEELQEKFSRENILHYGSLPSIILEPKDSQKKGLLRSYVETYLREEIQQEASTRNIPAFARFLELAGFENGHILNWSNIAREVGVHASTIKEYFQILQDTLLGFYLDPYSKSVRTKIVSHPKFYFLIQDSSRLFKDV